MQDKENPDYPHSIATEPLDRRKLQAFVAVLRNPSMAKAAEAVGVDKATRYRWIQEIPLSSKQRLFVSNRIARFCDGHWPQRKAESE